MDDLFLALSVPVPNLPDLTHAEDLALVAQHIERQKLLGDVILGQANPDDYLDALATHHLSVDRYLREVDQNLIQFI